MKHSGQYPCANPDCSKVLESADSATLWMNTEFGLSTLRCCRNQDCAKRAVDEARVSRGWRLQKGNVPPMKADEREEFLARRAAAQ